ncbi:MAG: alpha/beta hydrolase [Clostridia bacterium]|nr:alpha/beta hydrolase [Clostridia bacterium]
MEYKRLLSRIVDLDPGNQMAMNVCFACIFAAAWPGSDKNDDKDLAEGGRHHGCGCAVFLGGRFCDNKINMNIIKVKFREGLIMEFSDELNEFRQTHLFSKITVDGVTTSYLLGGNPNSKLTLVYLVGGTGFSVVWFKHIEMTEQEYRVLTFDYPMGIEKMEPLADYVMKLLAQLDIQNPVFIGASLGGMLAQVIGRKYADRTSGVCLYSTCSLSETSMKGLKKQYRSYGIILPLMKIVPYSWINKMVINVSKKQIGMQEGTEEEKAWITEFFTWVYQNYTKEFDIHMTSLMVDVAKLTPITKEAYAQFDDRSLLVLPLSDKAFPPEAQQDLLDMMPRAAVQRLEGGHIATLNKVDNYVNSTKVFLRKLKEKEGWQDDN